MKRNVMLFIASLLFLAVGTTAIAETYIPDKRSTGIVNWGNGKAYFFKGSQYIRYDIKADKADPGYPKTVDNNTWPGITW
jgi:hypothetical protein